MLFFVLFWVFIVILSISSNGKGVFFAAMALSTIGSMVMLNRDFFLSFLSPTVMPTSLLEDREIDHATIKVKIPVEDDDATHVVFWASGPGSSDDLTPQKAYGKFKNSGIKKIAQGEKHVEVKIMCPSSYVVKRFGRQRKLEPHVHYRFAYDSGLLGPVKTAEVLCKE